MIYTAQRYDFRDKPADYARLAQDLSGLLADESDRIANAANTAALIFAALPDINWAGFYFLRGTELVLGPFQGKPACVRIGLGQGVCGADVRSWCRTCRNFPATSPAMPPRAPRSWCRFSKQERSSGCSISIARWRRASMRPTHAGWRRWPHCW